MATALHGKDGYVYWNGTAVALVSSWNMSGGPNWDDITAMDSGGWGQILAGIKRFTGSVTVRYATDDAVQSSMRANVIGGTPLILKLHPNGTAAYFSGSAGLTLDMTVDHNAPDEATYNFTSHGPWTYT